MQGASKRVRRRVRSRVSARLPLGRTPVSRVERSASGLPRLSLLGVLLAFGLACREAPGPADCLRLANAVYPAGEAQRSEVEGEMPPSLGPSRVVRSLASRATRRASFVRECLTMPYDRRLVDCAVVEDAHGQKRCWSAFEARYEERYGTGS